jgi:hypothetical protein
MKPEILTLYKNVVFSGMWLERDNPARYVAAFNSQSDEAKRLAKFGYASLQATSKLVHQ